MIIFPKTNEYLEGLEALRPYIDKGIEIQFLSKDNFDDVIEKTLRDVKNKIPQLEEIIIHPPIKYEFDFEVLAFSKFEIEKARLNNLVKLSKELHISIKMLYHTHWNYMCWKKSGAMERMKELVSIIEDTNVTIVIENLYPLVEILETEKCTVLDIANDIDSEHLKVCLDICHLHCLANIFKLELNEFLEKYLDKEKAKKYIFQIHFAGTLDNDGYIDHDTHGRVHDSLASLKEDYEILKRYNIEDKVIVTEIAENNYETRADQIKEIKMLSPRNRQEPPKGTVLFGE